MSWRLQSLPLSIRWSWGFTFKHSSNSIFPFELLFCQMDEKGQSCDAANSVASIRLATWRQDRAALFKSALAKCSVWCIFTIWTHPRPWSWEKPILLLKSSFSASSAFSMIDRFSRPSVLLAPNTGMNLLAAYDDCFSGCLFSRNSAWSVSVIWALPRQVVIGLLLYCFAGNNGALVVPQKCEATTLAFRNFEFLCYY